MAYTDLGHSAISGVTGTFEGGCLGFWNGEYLLLDQTSTTASVIRIQATPVDMGVPTLTAVSDAIELPPGSYYGIGTMGGSVGLLREKGVFCEDGKIAVAELLSIDVTGGGVLGEQELYSFQHIQLAGGMCAVSGNWRFLGEFGGAHHFYEVFSDSEIREIADFRDSVSGRSALAYDGAANAILVLNGSRQALGFNPEWSRSATELAIPLNSGNTTPVGIAWSGSEVAVLNANPLGIYWYGEDGVVPGVTPTPSLTAGHQQLEMLSSFAQDFQIGAFAFKAIFGQTMRRVPVENGPLPFVEVSEKRITPVTTIHGAAVGMEIRQGAERYTITGVYSVANNYRQSFAVS